MQDSTPDSANESNQNSYPYKLIFGWTLSIDDFETLQDDPTYKEIMRINSQLLERLRSDNPGVVLDVSTIVEALPSEVL